MLVAVTNAIRCRFEYVLCLRGNKSPMGLGRVTTRLRVLNRPRLRCKMLGERFRAYFSDIDHRHKLPAPARSSAFWSCAEAKVRALYALAAAIIRAMPIIL
jgi:hypothetical protein